MRPRPRTEIFISFMLTVMGFSDSFTSHSPGNPQLTDTGNIAWTPFYKYDQSLRKHEIPYIVPNVPKRFGTVRFSPTVNQQIVYYPTRNQQYPTRNQQIVYYPSRNQQIGYYPTRNQQFVNNRPTQRFPDSPTFFRRTSVPDAPNDIAIKIQILADTINGWIGSPGLGFGTNGTAGVIGDVNEIINDVSKVIIDTIRFKLEFLQHLIDKKTDFFLPPLLGVLDDLALKFEKFMTLKFGVEFGNFARSFNICMRKSFQCHFLPVLSKVCLTHCVLTSIPDGTPLAILVDFWTKLIERILKFFCNPIHTIFHSFWKFYMKHLAAGTIYSLSDSMTSMGLNMEELMGAEFERLVPLTMTRILRPFRQNNLIVIFEKLVFLLKKFNPACWALEVKLAPKYFAELFNYNPRMIDTFLGSVIFISTLVQGLPLPTSRRRFVQRFHKGMDIVTGLNCGVIFWTGTNGSAICEQRKDIVKGVQNGG